jgi:hypothetical protein
MVERFLFAWPNARMQPDSGAWLELRKQYGDEVGELARVLAEV